MVMLTKAKALLRLAVSRIKRVPGRVIGDGRQATEDPVEQPPGVYALLAGVDREPR